MGQGQMVWLLENSQQWWAKKPAGCDFQCPALLNQLRVSSSALAEPSLKVFSQKMHVKDLWVQPCAMCLSQSEVKHILKQEKNGGEQCMCFTYEQREDYSLPLESAHSLLRCRQSDPCLQHIKRSRAKCEFGSVFSFPDFIVVGMKKRSCTADKKADQLEEILSELFWQGTKIASASLVQNCCFSMV